GTEQKIHSLDLSLVMYSMRHGAQSFFI
ncbi:uncharacterized protein METZ01_LOCUS424060, partial [marine metagenome]